MEFKRGRSPSPPSDYYQAKRGPYYEPPPPVFSPILFASGSGYGPTNLSPYSQDYQSQPTNLSLGYHSSGGGHSSFQSSVFPQQSSSNSYHPAFHHPPPHQDIPSQLLSIELELVNKLKPILIPPPVSYIYSPLEYAYEPHSDYVRKYCKNRKRVLFLGMNPGPWGMSQTGVPFGEVNLTSSWLKVEGRIGKPLLEHPSRIIEGFSCPRSEVSGQRFWSYFKDLCKVPEVLFKYSYVHNYCPLAFMKDSGRNVTPPELKARERNLVFQSCDEALLRVIRLLDPEIIIGVGKFPQQRAAGVVQAAGLRIRVESILHPSPVNPTANKGWREVVHKQLTDLGLMGYFYCE